MARLLPVIHTVTCYLREGEDVDFASFDSFMRETPQRSRHQ